MDGPRVTPLAPSELDDRQRAFLQDFTDGKGRYPNIFGVLCRNMPLMEAWRGFGLYTMTGAQTPPQLRELLILRTARHARCEYERHHHRRIAGTLGVSEQRMDHVENGELTGDLDDDLMIRVADELAERTCLSTPVWDAMTSRFGLECTLDAIFTVGAYTALAMGLNSCGVQIERRGTPATAA